MIGKCKICGEENVELTQGIARLKDKDVDVLMCEVCWRQEEVNRMPKSMERKILKVFGHE